MRADTQPYPASRPNFFIRAAAVALAMFVMLSSAAVAQNQAAGPGNADEASTPKVRGPDGEEITDAECTKFEGSTAPVQRLARLAGAMSVRNLEFTYFGKPLHALTAKEFALLRILKPFCDGTPSEIDALILDRLEEKVNEARDTRDRTVQWINEATAKMDAMPPSPEAIREVHNLWTEMENRRLEMLASDQNFFANYLTERRNALYEGKQAKPRVLISPFDPGPTVPPDQKE
jgi:hypothetical protein